MAGDSSDPKPRRKHTSSSRRTSKVKDSSKRNDRDDDKDAISRPQPTLDELRKSRLEYFSTPAEQRRKTMKYVYDQPISSKTRVAKKESREKRSAVSSSRPKDGSSGKKKRRSRERDKDVDSDEDKVYVMRAEPKVEATPRRQSERESEDSVAGKSTADRPPSSKTNVTRKPPQRRHTAPVPVIEVEEKRSSTIVATPPTTPRRSSTIKIDSDTRRPSLKRSSTSAAAKTDVSITKSSAGARTEKKAPSVLGAFFSPRPAPPEKKVACLTCGDDEVPVSRSARLPCEHRMCHTCLKRIFKMSVTDPAHMPPRCCTDKHISLKHVDELFSQEFKKTWNRKFDEYKAKNRIYCVSKNCGQWIEPKDITVDKKGRKIGKCKRCKTKVCAVCNNKAHTSRECPKDPATKQFIATAKEKGWQKCFNCSAMVELKEGCNHMTCRCMAEFCMVCGTKWKSCDCPWFNYEAVDAHLGNPQRYAEELERRRDQEQRDEVLAHRMEALGVDEDDGGHGMFGTGNAAGHHMNANFIQQAREALTANYQNAEQAARGLINGWYTGRENRMPDIPEDLADVPRILRQASHRQRPRDEAEDGASPERRRRNTNRRRTQPVDIPPAFENGRYQPTEEDREQERRIREWATGVRE